MRFHEKNDFRKSIRWRRFSEQFIRSKQRTCEICGMQNAKMYNVHHKYKDDYENLSPHRFMCLCRECHLYCHRKQARLKDVARNIKKFTWE